MNLVALWASAGWRRRRWCYLFSRWNAVPSLVPLPPGPAALSLPPSAPLGEGTSTVLFFTSSKHTLHVLHVQKPICWRFSVKHSVKTTVSATALDFFLSRHFSRRPRSTPVHFPRSRDAEVWRHESTRNLKPAQDSSPLQKVVCVWKL